VRCFGHPQQAELFSARRHDPHATRSAEVHVAGAVDLDASARWCPAVAAARRRYGRSAHSQYSENSRDSQQQEAADQHDLRRCTGRLAPEKQREQHYGSEIGDRGRGDHQVAE